MREIELSTNKYLGPCIDVCAYGGYFYVIQNRDQYAGGRICKVSVDGNIVSEYSGIGGARQIEIKDGVAAITSREDGLWLFDVSSADIVLLSHYQTIEYATGVTLWNNFVFVSCRQYGVEVIDITDTENPKFISLIRIGEVQSACIYNGILFGGVWGDMNVAVVDIHNIENPKLITRLPLQGRGDGLTVDNGILYAAIGQHRRGIKNINDKNDPCFGNGNGFETFDISDINNIKHLKTVYTDNMYVSSFDTWRPYIFDKYAVIANSWLGFYVYDKKTYESIAHVFSKTKAYYDRILDANIDCDPIVGIAQIDSKLAVATARGGLSIIDNEYGNMNNNRYDDVMSAKCNSFYASSDYLENVFSCNGVVSDVCALDDNLLVAAGMCGFYIIDGSGNILLSQPTKGFCQNIKYANGYIYSAESDNGINIYSYKNVNIKLVSNINNNSPALQLVIDSTNKYIISCFGSTTMIVYDIINPNEPKEVCRRNAKSGPIYGENFALHNFADGSTVMFWHRDGLVLFNSSNNPTISDFLVNKRNGFMGFGPENGIECYNGKIYYNLDGGLIELSACEGTYAEDLPFRKGNGFISGKFIIYDNYIISSERAEGLVTVTEFNTLQELCKIKTNASPNRPVVINNVVYITGGHAGLLKLNI